MASVWGELKRRNVVKVAVAYAIVGWLLIEVASTVFPIVQLPDWTVTFLTMLILFGFPIALILSWAYELTPDGMERTKAVPMSESITKVTGRKLDFVIIGVLAIAVAYFAVERFVLDTAGPFAGADIDPASLEVVLDAPPSTVAEPTPSVSAEEQREVLPKSVAVLPFENLSPDPDNAYFAAGIHEAILNELAKIQAIIVIARTSVLPYADRETPIVEIARVLKVGTVMEGSVQYAEGRVRVTAQLIDPDTNAHLWSEDYDRDFVDIFAIQSDIAMNIANALEAEFLLSEQESIEKLPTQSSAAYALYLQSLRQGYIEARESLDRAIMLDPSFALAHATKALRSMYYYYTGPGSSTQAVEIERIIRDSAETALELDPNAGLAHAALGALHQFNWRGVEAEMEFSRASELSPNNVEVLVLYGRLKRYRNEYDESIRLTRRAIELDPNNTFTFGQLGLTYRDAANWDEAIVACWRFLVERLSGGIGCHIVIAQAEAMLGRSAETVARLELLEEREPNVFRLTQIAHAYSLTGQHGDARRIFAALQDAAVEEPLGEAYWSLANLAIANSDQALQHLEYAVTERVSADFITLSALAANPWDDPVLDEPEFQELFDRLWNDE